MDDDGEQKEPGGFLILVSHGPLVQYSTTNAKVSLCRVQFKRIVAVLQDLFVLRRSEVLPACTINQDYTELSLRFPESCPGGSWDVAVYSQAARLE